eukprot:TRINITY_DN91434_c0_g1_i1.p1 TRINITY_DN91434_c0_g1~~TRINITY_DN91434_c0_g1_i1.p1  ORF type:complete len:850 (+),score=133.32 TRINITY_DN91434_c0_g1_i1:2862-5411(+)
MVDDSTKLVFMTTATAMLQLFQSGLRFTHLIIDEVHERSIYVDILLALVKTQLLSCFKELRVVLMSAAMDAQRLCKYLADGGTEPHLFDLQAAPPYPINIKFIEHIDFFRNKPLGPMKNPELASFLLHLHQQRPLGDNFLVFLAGKNDVQQIYETLLAETRDGRLKVKPLYGGMSIEAQTRVLHACPVECAGCMRTIILATDVVESSITIPDVAVVVDTLKHKRRRWNADQGVSPLTLEDISRDEAEQRKGRAGRTGPGDVYRMITRSGFARLQQHAMPQIWSERLEEMLLTLYEQTAIDNPRAFLKHFLDPPEAKRVDACIKRFLELGAMVKDPVTKRPVPSHFGRFLKFLPLDPDVCNLVMNGLRYGVAEECVILSAVHQRGDPFIDDPEMTPQQAQVLVLVRKVCTGKQPSDLIAGLMGYRAWRRKLEEQGIRDWSATDEVTWCAEHFLSLNKLNELEELRIQIFDALRENGYHTGVREAEKHTMKRRRRQHDKLTGVVEENQRLPARPLPSQQVEQELSRLLEPDHQDVDKRRLLHWCLASAFLHGVLVCENIGYIHELKFEPWQTLTSEAATEQRTWISSFLRRHGFAVSSARTGKDGDVFVKFSDQESARLAFQVCSLVGTSVEMPFKRCSRWGPRSDVVTSLKWCGDAECKIAQTSLTAVVPDTDTTIIASEFLPIKTDKGMFWLCTKCSQVPNGIFALALLATYEAEKDEDLGQRIRIEGSFFGCRDAKVFTKPADQDILNLVRSIRQDIDIEFKGPSGTARPDECRTIVATRQGQVLSLMRHLEAGNPIFTNSTQSFRSRAGGMSHHFAPGLRELGADHDFSDYELDSYASDDSNSFDNM